MSNTSENNNAAPKIPKIEYPDLRLWKIDGMPEKDKLGVVNPGDFPIRQIMEKLDLNSPLLAEGAISDRDEIWERHAMMQLMLDESFGLAEFVKGVSHGSNIPLGGKGFLNYFDPQRTHPYHWLNVHRFLEAVGDHDELGSKRLALVARTMRESL